MKKRVGIVGCGGIAGVHATALKQIDNIDLCGFVDCRKEKAETLANKFGGGGDTVFEDLESCIALKGLDAIHICTPHHLHVPMAIKALSQGVSVFMEKPPAICVQQFKELEEAAGNGVLGFCFQNRYNDSTIKVDQILAEGSLGDILGGRVFVTWNREKEYYTESDWRGRWETEGGGALINQAIHGLDLLLRWLGTPKRVEASIGNHHLQGTIETEDTVEAFIEFPKGVRGCFYATTAYVVDSPIIIEIACRHGRVRIEGNSVNVKYYDGEEIPYSWKYKELDGKPYWGAGHLACIKDFYCCIEKGVIFQNDISSVKNTFQVMMDIYCKKERERIYGLY